MHHDFLSYTLKSLKVSAHLHHRLDSCLKRKYCAVAAVTTYYAQILVVNALVKNWAVSNICTNYVLNFKYSIITYLSEITCRTPLLSFITTFFLRFKMLMFHLSNLPAEAHSKTV